jgi:hypothetical protein
MTTTGDVSQRTRFNVREFARTARGNHREGLELAEYATTPLSEESLNVVRILGRLESATMERLRNLLVTATHKDARVTAFLVTWAFEKFWIADALDAVLEANGAPRAQDVEDGPKRHGLDESVSEFRSSRCTSPLVSSTSGSREPHTSASLPRARALPSHRPFR